MTLVAATALDHDDVVAFLTRADLTVSGIAAERVRIWLERDVAGRVVATTGYELSSDGRHALVRSVAVDPADRLRGRGRDLAEFAIAEAAREGAHTAWLFSRRSGPFWQRLGFAPADRSELARVLSDTHQVKLFTETGQLHSEVAWSRKLSNHR